ncbi:haloalkane dehalogenase [Tepidicaulis sp. LMO-SS28]|uniref:haloalkane dehalogenase n=1 Tax=Tepidicaulis sp. LMO-SS28 TaxID=3447455 RepID=UPI003EE0F560
MTADISPREHTKKKISVGGLNMAYVEMGGEGGNRDPILFLHGNPTSSYLWRNVMPHLQDQGRCIAPDLIGMGSSDKLEASGPDRYTFKEHREYLDRFIEAVSANGNVTLVIHDWGSALGFDWANRHRGAVKAIAYMEAIVRPLEWSEWNEAARPVFEGLRSPAGEEMILEKNTFIERILPGSILRDLTEEEMEIYRRPFRNKGEDRRPTLTWPRQIPLGGEPHDVVDIVQSYAEWMAENELPKLFVNAEPGAILTGPARDFCRSWKNQTEVTVKGSHFIQEDSPHEIGRAIAEWHKTL